MSIFSKSVFAGAVGLLAGCAMQDPPAPPVVAYNPPPAAVGAMTPVEIAWQDVTFASNSTRIDAAGRDTVSVVVASMQANPRLQAIVIGKTDSIGSDANNMRLSKQRADAVRRAIMRAGKLPASRFETRWTGERPQRGAAAGVGNDASARSVSIGLH